MAAADIHYKRKPRPETLTELYAFLPLIVVAVLCFVVVALNVRI